LNCLICAFIGPASGAVSFSEAKFAGRRRVVISVISAISSHREIIPSQPGGWRGQYRCRSTHREYSMILG
jgi:hypothetical protein